MIGGTTGGMPAGAATTHITALGMWFVMLAVLTAGCALAAVAKNIALFCVLGMLAAGSALLASGYLSGTHTTIVVGGWVLVASVGAAIYTGLALILADSYGRTILQLGKFKKGANVLGRVIAHPIEYPGGMPGVRVGQ